LRLEKLSPVRTYPQLASQDPRCRERLTRRQTPHDPSAQESSPNDSNKYLQSPYSPPHSVPFTALPRKQHHTELLRLDAEAITPGALLNSNGIPNQGKLNPPRSPQLCCHRLPTPVLSDRQQGASRINYVGSMCPLVAGHDAQTRASPDEDRNDPSFPWCSRAEWATPIPASCRLGPTIFSGALAGVVVCRR
jgi:hypothetical protein